MLIRARISRHRDDQGYVALVSALLISTVLVAAAAVGVDIARWYLVAERVQNAADSAALSGVVYMPNNFAKAVTTARKSAELNGYLDGRNATVDVTIGAKSSQLRVVITTSVENQFGSAIGVPQKRISRQAVADYTSPAPMGSPCNTFGNEPPGGSLTSSPSTSVIPLRYNGTCSATPQFWGGITGPQTDKQQGDRYSPLSCTDTYGCNEMNENTEAIYPDGYFYAIKVGERAKNADITVQIYDPAYYNTGSLCTSMPETPKYNSINPYTTSDATIRYSDSKIFCNGDSRPGSSSTANPVSTTFLMRSAADNRNPTSGTPIPDCISQFKGQHSAPQLNTISHNSRGSTDYSRTAQSSYNPEIAATFHQWYPLCTFNPGGKVGEYFLQVRTNVAWGGVTLPGNNNGRTRIIARGNTAAYAAPTVPTTGLGSNKFAIRAFVAGSPTDQRNEEISVSGWSRMPMYQNAQETVTFNLLRVLPAAAGQSIKFRFYDVADGSTDKGTVRVVAPSDASGAASRGLSGCTGKLNDGNQEPLAACSVNIENSKHNGQVQEMTIPVPDDYLCNETLLTGCWFKVEIKQNGDVTDFTTWDASLEGDPVRLIE